jgi:hypothetical protein
MVLHFVQDWIWIWLWLWLWVYAYSLTDQQQYTSFTGAYSKLFISYAPTPKSGTHISTPIYLLSVRAPGKSLRGVCWHIPGLQASLHRTPSTTLEFHLRGLDPYTRVCIFKVNVYPNHPSLLISISSPTPFYLTSLPRNTRHLPILAHPHAAISRDVHAHAHIHPVHKQLT